MSELTLVQTVAVWALPVLFAITLHEVAHGWVARKLGDPTAYMLGRLSLNPIRHIDPIGTVVVPLLLLVMGGFVFGWAKPVPVTWENLRNPRRDMALVALAGPMANLLMAFAWGIIAKVGYAVADVAPMPGQMLILMGGHAGIPINLMLMVLNLIPLLPLDGGRIVSSLLPGPVALKFNRIEPYGFIILLGLLVTGVLWTVMAGPMYFLGKMIYDILGL